VTPRQSTPQNAQLSPDAASAKVTAPVTQQAPPPPKDVQSSRKELDQAVKAVNDFVQSANNSLQFSVDEGSGKTVVKVIDIATKEVIKQFPSEEMLAIAKALDGIKGLLVHQKA
jgi:flagellar protein FlaG